MQHSTTHGRIEWHGPKRWSLIAGAVTLAVGAMMILAPNAAASSPNMITAPYTGSSYGDTYSFFSGCGGSLSVSSPPWFNMTNGHGTYAFKDGQVSCGKLTNYTDVYAETFVAIYPFSLPSAHWAVEANWKATFTVKLVATPGSASQHAYSTFNVAAYTYVYDSTNETYIAETGYNFVQHEISTGAYSMTYKNVNFHDWLNYTFVSSHTYTLYTYFETYLAMEASPGSSSATGSFSMASSTHQAILESIYESALR